MIPLDPPLIEKKAESKMILGASKETNSSIAFQNETYSNASVDEELYE